MNQQSPLVLQNFLIAKIFDFRTTKTALRKTIRSAVHLWNGEMFQVFRSYSNYERLKTDMKKFSKKP